MGTYIVTASGWPKSGGVKGGLDQGKQSRARRKFVYLLVALYGKKVALVGLVLLRQGIHHASQDTLVMQWCMILMMVVEKCATVS